MIKRSVWGIILNLTNTLLGLIIIPIIIKTIGIKDYAIIGLYLTIQSIVLVLEGGLGIETLRIVVKSGLNPELSQQNNLYKLISSLSTFISFLVSLIVFYSWELDYTSSLIISVLISLSIYFRLCSGFYKAQLFGLNKHNLVFGLNIKLFVIRFVLPLVVSKSIIVFMLFGLISSMVEFYYLKFCIKNQLNYFPSVDKNFLKNFKNISIPKAEISISSASLLGIFLMNVDKFILSIQLTQSNFGQYQSLFAIATGIFLVIGPINSIFQPILIKSFNNKESNFKKIFNAYFILISFLIWFTQSILILFHREITTIWLGNEFTLNSSILKDITLFGYSLYLFGIGFMLSIISGSFKEYIKLASICIITQLPLWYFGLIMIDLGHLLIINALIVSILGAQLIKIQASKIKTKIEFKILLAKISVIATLIIFYLHSQGDLLTRMITFLVVILIHFLTVKNLINKYWRVLKILE